jgi:NAD(P)-dependent dehydrogenase (short-subunit alcohol dehydrogenase family)
MQPFDWSSKTVWVTGASSGLGRALALLIAQRGARVIAAANDPPGLASLAEEARQAGLSVIAQECDVTDHAGVEAAVVSAEAIAPIDVAILNAGVLVQQHAQSFDPEAFRRVFEVNVQGVANSLAPLMQRMIARKSGRLVFISSISAEQPAPGMAAYGASKAAVSYMAAALRFDLAKHGVGVQVAVPGWIETPLVEAAAVARKFRRYWITPNNAAGSIIAGIERGSDEIRFPRLMMWAVKAVGWLPSRLRSRLVAYLCRSDE